MGPGRPAKITFEALLIVLLAIVEGGEAPHLANIAKAIRFRLTQHDAKDLGIPAEVYEITGDAEGRAFWELDEDDWDTATFVIAPDKLYDWVQGAFTRLTDRLEPYPGVAGPKARPAGKVQDDIDALDEADVALKKERLETVCNAIVRASLQRLPRYHRRWFMQYWHGAVTIDGTNVPIYTHKDTGGLSEKNRKLHPDWTHHAEAMGGWYIREGNHAGYDDDGVTKLGEKYLKDRKWAYELHVAVAIKSIKSKGPVPNVALGMAFDAPAGRIGENSLTALLSATQVCHDMDIKPDIAVGDKAILPSSKWETFQKPARALGWRFAFAFRKDQHGNIVPATPKKTSPKGKGRRGTITAMKGTPDPLRGAKMVDGEILCPGAPQEYIDAEKDFQYGRIDKATRDQRLEEREAYKATRTERWNRDGRSRHACPATTLGGKVKCALREQLIARIESSDRRERFQAIIDAGKDRTLVENPPAHPGDICTTHQDDVAITLDSNTGKYALDVEFNSKNHLFMTGQREVVEAFNASMKESDHEALGDRKRRPVRGFARQALLVAALVFARNMRAIRTFIHAYGHILGPQPTDPGPQHPSGPTDHTTGLDNEDLPPPDVIAA